MKNKLHHIIWGSDKRFNGLIALGLVTLFVLGCNCSKLQELAEQQQKNSGDGPSNSSSSSNTSKTPKKDKDYEKADASKKEIPSDEEMQEIVKTTLLDFNDALQQADFTTFHSNVSRVWQKQTTPAKLKKSFQPYIDGEADMSAISSMDATFTSPGRIIKESGISLLDVKGEYSTIPTNFDLQYIAEGKEWKLFGIRVKTAVKNK